MMERLAKMRGGLRVYDAGLPRFPRNFTRDSVIAALLAEDAVMMRDQLLFCARHQGKTADPLTGEEPGKIHHEYPGYPLRDRMTTYNACDSTAFFLIGHDFYVNKTADHSLIEAQSNEIALAVQYIESHLNAAALFEESPHLCGAEQFALKVTYWKDSEILDRPNGQPIYPVSYLLAHAQNLAAMRSAARLLNSDTLAQTAIKMCAALRLFWDDAAAMFNVALDQNGAIQTVTSDALHALYFLEPGDLTPAQLAGIERASEALETSIGYMNMSPEEAAKAAYNYHANTIWPFEQGMIHAGAGKFGLDRVQRVCERVQRAIDGRDPETLQIRITTDDAPSCDPQLWTIAAKRYFDL